MRFLGIPMHPALVHFPIAFWVAAMGFDVWSLVSGSDPAGTFARWAVWIGVLTAFPAILTGLLDLRGVGSKGETERALNRHMLLMLTATAAYAGQGLARMYIAEPMYLFALNLACLGLLLVGAHQGGKLVYKFGVGLEDRIGDGNDQ